MHAETHIKSVHKMFKKTQNIFIIFATDFNDLKQ